MEPIYGPETGLNITGEICLDLHQTQLLRDSIAHYAWTYGAIMLIIGVVIGVVVSWSVPKVRTWIRNW